MEKARAAVPVSATDEERARVVALAAALQGEGHVLRGPTGECPIPGAVAGLLRQVVEALANGDAVSVVPVGRELTTQQAADLVNVSRQYLVRLLDDGKIPFSRTGSHRRIRMEDVLRYRVQRDQERARDLTELTRLHEEMGGYDE